MGGPQTGRKTGKNKSVENSEAWCKGDTVWKALLEEPSPPSDLLEGPHGTQVGCLLSSGSRLTGQGSSPGPDASARQPSMGVLVNPPSSELSSQCREEAWTLERKRGASWVTQPGPRVSPSWIQSLSAAAFTLCICVQSLVQWPWAPFVLFWPHPEACRILVPQPGMEPMPPAVDALSLNHWTIREVLSLFFLIPTGRSIPDAPRPTRLRLEHWFFQACVSAVLARAGVGEETGVKFQDVVPTLRRPRSVESIGRREFCPQIMVLGREDHCSPTLPTQGSTGGAHWPQGNSTAWDSSSSGPPHPVLCSPPRRRLGHPGLNPLTSPLSHLPAFARATNPEHPLCRLGKGSCVFEGPAGASPLPQLSPLPRQWSPPTPT